MRAEMRTPSLSARDQCLFLADFLGNKGFALSRNTTLGKTSGPKSPLWRIRGTIWVLAPSEMNAFMRSVDSSVALNKKSMTLLSSTKSIRTSGKFSLSGWRTPFGLARLWQSQTPKSYWLEVRTQIETERSTSLTFKPRTGNPSTTWTNWGSATSLSSSKTRFTL